jgi:hypothetical protein
MKTFTHKMHIDITNLDSDRLEVKKSQKNVKKIKLKKERQAGNL